MTTPAATTVSALPAALIGQQVLVQFTIPFVVAGVDATGTPGPLQQGNQMVNVPAFPFRFDGEDAEYFYMSYVPGQDAATRCHTRVARGAVAFLTRAERSLVSVAQGFSLAGR